MHHEGLDSVVLVENGVDSLVAGTPNEDEMTRPGNGNLFALLALKPFGKCNHGVGKLPQNSGCCHFFV